MNPEDELMEEINKTPELSPSEAAASLSFATMLSEQMMPQMSADSMGDGEMGEGMMNSMPGGSQGPQDAPETPETSSTEGIQAYIDQALTEQINAKFDELRTQLSEALEDDEEEEKSSK